MWLYQNNYVSFRHALDKADAGAIDLSSAWQIFHIIFASYSGVFVFFAITLIFFGFSISWRNLRHGPQLHPTLFHYLSFYGLTLPILIILVLRTGHFSERWLSPLLFCLPLAVFSEINIQLNNRRFKLLGYLCIFIAVVILAARSFYGFFPDFSGKVERIHTPFSYVSQQLRQELEERGIDDLRDITIITNNDFVAANVAACLPGAKFFIFSRDHRVVKKETLGPGAKVLLWDVAKEEGEGIPEKYARKFPSAISLGPFRASFLYSSNFPPFALGAALVQ